MLDEHSRHGERLPEREREPSCWHSVWYRRCPNIVIVTAKTHVPVVRRTPDIQARHVDDWEYEAQENRGDAILRVIGTSLRGLHNSITDVGRLCRAPLRKGGLVISLRGWRGDNEGEEARSGCLRGEEGWDRRYGSEWGVGDVRHALTGQKHIRLVAALWASRQIETKMAAVYGGSVAIV